MREILAAVKVPDFSQTLETENLIIKLKPAAYFSTNLNNQINFEEQKLLRAVEQTELPDEERSNIIQTSMKRLIDIGLDNLTAVTEYIATADGDVVTDAAFIREFYYNVSSDTVNKINSQLAEFTKENSLPPLNATCTSCTKPFEVPVEFNYSSFFGKGF